MAAAGAGRLRRAASALLLRSPRLPARELSAPARLYHKKVVDHYENPRNVGSLDKTSKNVGTGLVGAPACGDVMKLQIQVDEKGKIVDARFKTFGCGSAIASSSLATEWVKGKTVEEALTIKNTDIAKELCLPPVKLHCSKRTRMLTTSRLACAFSIRMKKANQRRMSPSRSFGHLATKYCSPHPGCASESSGSPIYP
uniref:Iron-sulfur cluster assembly enzyme ISCU n=3 Tax=Laurasiatheria TaxID=314145 RepID=F7E1G5_HORSE